MIRARSGKTAAGRLLLGAGALALLIPAIAGCEAGNDAPTLAVPLRVRRGAHRRQRNPDHQRLRARRARPARRCRAARRRPVPLAVQRRQRAPTRWRASRRPARPRASRCPAARSRFPSDAAPVNLTGPQPEVVLNNLTTPLTGGSNVTLTLQFQHAGPVTLAGPGEAAVLLLVDLLAGAEHRAAQHAAPRPGHARGRPPTGDRDRAPRARRRPRPQPGTQPLQP